MNSRRYSLEGQRHLALHPPAKPSCYRTAGQCREAQGSAGQHHHCISLAYLHTASPPPQSLNPDERNIRQKNHGRYICAAIARPVLLPLLSIEITTTIPTNISISILRSALTGNSLLQHPTATSQSTPTLSSRSSATKLRLGRRRRGVR